MTVQVLQTQIQTNDPALKEAVRDKLLEDSNGGVVQLFNFGFPWSYPAGDLPRPAPTDPVNGDLIRDVTESGNDANVLASTSPSLFNYAGGGAFTSTEIQSGTTHNYALVNTTGNLSGFTQTTQYLIVAYMKLASTENFRPNGESISAYISACNSNSVNYSNGTELVLFGTTPLNGSGVGALTARFQNALGSVDRVDIELPTGVGLYDDDIVQVALWYDGSNAYMRVKSELFEQTESVPHTGNTLDVSGNSVKFDTSSGQFGGTSVPHKLYRCALENLTVSGRNPITVLDADFARTISRGVFS